MHILLIEPDKRLRERWLQRLSLAKHDVKAAADYESAFKTHGTSYAAVFCRLIETAGPESTQIVGRLKVLGELAICLVGEGDDEARDKAFSAGFSDCVSVECSDQELTAKLDHATQLTQLAARLAQAQKLESIGELAAGIAHEINTPIQYVGDNTRFVQTACLDLAEVLTCCQDLVSVAASGSDVSSVVTRLNQAMETADVEYLIEEIPSAITQTLEGVDRVSGIVRAMKEFAHPGVSEMTLTDLSSSISNTIMVARNEWKYVADFKTEFDPDLEPVPCLPGEINQVLLNMIVNASHAIASALGDSPDTKGTITVSTKRSSNHAEIRVQDSGGGIDPQNVEKIFAPFFTTKGAGKGTGQGLAIARTVVEEKHGGEILVESELGKGTTFLIRLPLSQSSSNDESYTENENAIAMNS